MKQRIVAAVMVLACAGLLNGCAYLKRASESSQGVSPAGPSERPDLSHDGRYVAFDSPANGLVPGDNNDLNDIFVRDNLTAAVTRVSVASDGSPGNGSSFTASISATGRYIAFESYASDLVLGDANGEVDVFRHDRDSDADGVFDEPGAIRTVAASANATTGDGPSTSPTLTRAGTVVTYQSSATNIATNLTDTNGFTDIYITQFDPETGDSLGPVIMSINRNLGQQPVLANGHSRQGESREDLHAITFATAATNLTISPDTNGFEDVVVRTEEFAPFGEVTLALPLQVSANADSFAPRFVGNSTRVAYTSGATNVVDDDVDVSGQYDVFVTDYSPFSPSTVCISRTPAGNEANGSSMFPSPSDDGTRIAFESTASDLVPLDTNGLSDVFVRAESDVTQRASTTVLLEQADAASRTPAVSGDGVYVAFASDARNLEVPDTNADADVFVRATVVPEIQSVVVIDPNTGGELPPVLHPGSNELLVKGHGFGPVVSASLGRGVTSTTSTVQSHQVRLLVVIAPGTPAGSRNLLVANAGTGLGPVAGSARAFPVQIAAT